MTENFDQLVHDAQVFFAALKDNNDRAWFQDRKAEYDATIRIPATHFADQVGAELSARTGVAHIPKIFRQYRDVRFSRDKSPYHCHVHILWKPAEGPREGPAYFFGVSPDYVTTGAGVMAFGSQGLAAFRAAVAGEAGDRLAAVLAGLIAAGCRMDEPALKRVPKPYDAAHRHGDLLRHKGLVVWRDIDTDRGEGTLPAVTRECARFEPLVSMLGEI